MDSNQREQCSVKLWHSGFGQPCQKKAKVERAGRWYCGIHDPEYVAAKSAKREEEWRVKLDQLPSTKVLQRVAVSACEKINPANPLAVANSIVDMYKTGLRLLDVMCELCRKVNPQHATCQSCDEIEEYRKVFAKAKGKDEVKEVQRR